MDSSKIGKSDLGKDKFGSERSIDNLLKNENSNISVKSSTVNKGEYNMVKSRSLSPVDIMKKKIESELRKKPEFKNNKLKLNLIQ
jgi:hypothetical protein